MTMLRRLKGLARFRWLGYPAALAAVALVSAAIAFVPRSTQLANVSMLYLVAVLGTAATFGSGPAVLAAITAFVSLNFLFVDPRYTLSVADPAEWIALLGFLVTAGVTGQLGAAQRRRAEEARRREREAVVLYDVVRLMADADVGQALYAVADRLRQELRLVAVAIELTEPLRPGAAAGDLEALQVLSGPNAMPARILRPGAIPTALSSGAPGRWIRIVPPGRLGSSRRMARGPLFAVPVQAGDRVFGTILLVPAPNGLSFTATDDRLLSAVAAQLGQALDRVHLHREAINSEVLQRTDVLKTALLNAVSHDLRTPLASIITAAGSLRQEHVSWSKQDRRELAETIEQEAIRLNRIVGNLLNLSRVEAGNLRPEKSWYDLGALVNDVLGRLRPLTAQHRLLVSVPDDLPPAFLDYVELDQVLSNLIENAVRHTPSGTEVSLTVRHGNGRLEIEVADRGPGIPEDTLPRVFQPFSLADGTSTGPRRTGLGLAVARGFVEAHGGTIWAENRLGGGARFVVTLPLGELVETAPGGPRL